MKKRLVTFSAIALLAAASTTRAQVGGAKPSNVSKPRPPIGIGNRKVQTGALDAQQPQMVYHGGPVMLGTTTLHYIWYGNWRPEDDAVAILTDLANSLGGSDYYRINRTYYDGSFRPVANSLRFGQSIFDSYSRGQVLDDDDVRAIVAAQRPRDPNAIYLVLTSADVEQARDETACGWHTHAVISWVDIKYGWVRGNTDGCAGQTRTSPNGDVMADAMASVIAHEVSEAVTDPDLNAWFDPTGEENADKCSWTFGTTYRTRNGALANMRLGERDFLIQQNWVNLGPGYCSTGLAPSQFGRLDTADGADILAWHVERAVVSSDIVEFRLCQQAALTWQKTLVMRDGTGGRWNLTVRDDTKCVTDSLWAHQVNNGQVFPVYKAKVFGRMTNVGEIDPSDFLPLPPGSRLTFTWLRD